MVNLSTQIPLLWLQLSNLFSEFVTSNVLLNVNIYSNPNKLISLKWHVGLNNITRSKSTINDNSQLIFEFMLYVIKIK